MPSLLRNLALAAVLFALGSFFASARAANPGPQETQSSGAASDASFAAGVQSYRDGAWADARANFLEALAAGDVERGSVLRNLGNVAYREGKPLEAAGWFTAAVREAPRDAEAWRNLEFARREAGLDPADRGDLRDTAVRLATMLRLDEAERLVLSLLALLALVLVWEALRGGLASKIAACSVSVLLALAFVPYGVQWAAQDARPQFVIQPEGAALNSEPRDAAALVGRLTPASVVEQIDALPGWVRVRSDAGLSGWSRESSLLSLSDAR
jgi:tetratricopeptide (TPR) repeat protein